MPILTRIPTNNFSGDSGQTTLPPQNANGNFGNISNTGYGPSAAVANQQGVLARRSGRWSNFEPSNLPLGVTINSVRLKFNYSINASNSGFLNANDFGRMFADYQINGGGWIPVLNQSFGNAGGSNSGSVDVSLSPLNLQTSLVELRTRTESFKQDSGTYTTATSISNIRIEIDYTEPPLPPPTAQIPNVIIMM
jgi:hypothetical protein